MDFVKFEINNFKGIKELTIELNKLPVSKVFTLVGLNESGKTSILEAINLFQQPQTKENIHNYIPKGQKYSFNSEISVEATLALKPEDNEEILKYAIDLGYKSIKPINTISIRRSYEFVNSNYQQRLDYWTISLLLDKRRGKKSINLHHTHADWKTFISLIETNLMPSIIYYPNFLFDFPERIYITEEPEESKENIRYRDIIQDILTSVDSKLTIKEHILDRLEKPTSSNRGSLEHTLSLLSAKISQTVFTAWDKIFYSGSKQIEIVPGEETKPSTHPPRHYLEFKLKEGPNRFLINERSLGFKWFFSFLLFTEFRKNRTSDSGQILFLLDEPASNLHSTAQKKLLDTFKDLVSKSILIYTTHSHHLINPEWLSGAYVVRNKALNYESEFIYDPNQTDIQALPYKKFISSYPNQQDYFQPILDILEYQPGLLEKIPYIIIFEGKNDYYTLKYMTRIHFPENYKNINFYPGGGADNNNHVIALYLAWSRPFMVILDGDKAGVSAKSRYNQTFGEEIKEVVYTLSDVSDEFKGLSMESLFSDEEKLSISQKFFPLLKAYDKGKFNTSIQTLLYLNEKIMLSQKTLNNFKTLIKFIESKNTII